MATYFSAATFPLTLNLQPPPYRPSRVSENPAAVGRQRAGLFSTVGIPAYAGRTVGAAGRTVERGTPLFYRPFPAQAGKPE